VDHSVPDERSSQRLETDRPAPSRRTLALLVLPILAVVVVGTIGNAIHPTLVAEHPLVLVAMEPRNRFLLLVADKVDYVPFLLVATARRLVSDPLFYVIGYLYGERGVRWIGRRFGANDELSDAVRRGFARAAPVMVFLWPGAIVCALAGAAGMNPVAFIAINLAGTVTIVTLLYHFADYFDGPLGAINRFYSDNAKTLTVISVVLILVWVLYQYRQGRGELQSIKTIEEELSADEGEGGEAAREVAAAGSGEAAPTAAPDKQQGGGRSSSAGRPEHE
jgi:membrane protein DedA with SNARE-associated domain